MNRRSRAGRHKSKRCELLHTPYPAHAACCSQRGFFMLHLFVHWGVAALLLAWPGTHLTAAEAQVHTDANLVTVLDVSGSIMRHEEWLEFEGLAKAIVDAAVLDAIAGGRHRRIGFAGFTWSSGGRFDALVPWTLIASIDDAERVAATLHGFG